LDLAWEVVDEIIDGDAEFSTSGSVVAHVQSPPSDSVSRLFDFGSLPLRGQHVGLFPLGTRMRLDAPSANRVILWERGQGYAHAVDIPPALRDELLTYLFCTSPDRTASSPSCR
jgi:hypothetical protein